MKRLIGVLLAVCLMLSIATAAAGAADINESAAPQSAAPGSTGCLSVSFDKDSYNQFVEYLTSLDKDDLLRKLNLSGLDAQTVIDSAASVLGLSKEDVAKAIEEVKQFGVKIGKDLDWSKLWDAAKSVLPGDIINLYYPEVTVRSVTKGLEISWKKTIAANWFRVYIKSDGKWKKLRDVKGTSTVDTAVKSGTKYTYTVRALSDDRKSYLSGYLKDGVTCTFIAAPVVSLANAADGVTVKWSKSNGAAKYRVFYQTEKGWVKLKDTTALSVTDTAVKSGKTYAYTVRCLSADGKSYTGGYLAGKKITFISAPKFSLSKTKTGVKIAWSKSNGAAKYRVFIKSGSSWKKLKDTTALTVTDTAVKAGKTYTYTVRCLSKDGKSYTSAYREGQSIKFTK